MADPIAVTRLTLTDFRNYPHVSIETDARPVVLTGANGAGKTNLLEAVSLLVPGRGLRAAPFEALARSGGSGGWAVAAELDGLVDHVRIGTGLEAGETHARSSRSVRIEREPASVNALGDHVSALWLTPAMDGIFTGPASERRRFIDRLTLALDPGHGAQTARFERAMRQRNKLLGDPRPDHRWLDSIEAEMAGPAVAVAAARCETVARLSAAQDARSGGGDLFPAFAVQLHGELETALEAASATGVEDGYRNRLGASRRLDGAAGRTLRGPHRSDLAVTHLGKGVAAAMASTGEQKALLIGLTLAHADIVARRDGLQRPPLLLLDEIAAHLDDMRRAALYERLLDLGCQAWMTGTDRSLFAAIEHAAQCHEVSSGTIASW